MWQRASMLLRGCLMRRRSKRGEKDTLGEKWKERARIAHTMEEKQVCLQISLLLLRGLLLGIGVYEVASLEKRRFVLFPFSRPLRQKRRKKAAGSRGPSPPHRTSLLQVADMKKFVVIAEDPDDSKRSCPSTPISCFSCSLSCSPLEREADKGPCLLFQEPTFDQTFLLFLTGAAIRCVRYCCRQIPAPELDDRIVITHQGPQIRYSDTEDRSIHINEDGRQIQIGTTKGKDETETGFGSICTRVRPISG